MTAPLLENESWTQQVIEDVQKTYPSQVFAIRYRLGTDRSGDPAIFLHIVLKDATANNRKQLADMAHRLRRDLSDRLELPHTDYTPYYRFLSESEVHELANHEWA